MKTERYALSITSALLRCLDDLLANDTNIITAFSKTQQDDTLPFIFRIAAACAHLKEYTVANLSHKNRYTDKVLLYKHSSIFESFEYFFVFNQIIPSQIREPILSIGREMFDDNWNAKKSYDHLSEFLTCRYDALKSLCKESVTIDSVSIHVQCANHVMHTFPSTT